MGGDLQFADGMAMFVNRERVVYAGPFGRPKPRRIGAYCFYFAPGAPFDAQVDDQQSRRSRLELVPPHVTHSIQTETEDGVIGLLLIEPETVCADDMQLLGQRVSLDPEGIHERFRVAYEDYMGRSGDYELGTAEIDAMFLGAPLRPRLLDPRIASVTRHIIDHPWQRVSAEQCAVRAGISFTHFLHLFKRETGVPFRALGAWKRARSVLAMVQSKKNLTQMALDAGYPDSTHFSHSFRRFYGLKPSDVISGSQRLKLQSVLTAA